MGKIVSEAARLFTEQDYEDTPTLQFASETSVSELVTNHHLEGRDKFFQGWIICRRSQCPKGCRFILKMAPDETMKFE